MIKNISMSYISKEKMEKLVLNNELLKDPSEKEIQVKIFRAGISMGDIIEGSNTVKKIKNFPWTPGYDFSGIVTKTGPGVQNIKTGQRVTGHSPDGCYRKYINTLEDFVVVIPDEVDFSTAALVNINYTTAFKMIRRVAALKKGDSALVHSAAGGIGSAVLELAKLWEITVYGTASSKKQDFVRSLGGFPIDYTKSDFVKAVIEEEPDGVDAVFETIGMDNAFRSRKTLKKSGILLLSGSIELNSKKTTFFSLIKKALTLLIFNKGYKTKLFIADPASKKGSYKEDLTTILEYAKEGRIKPALYKTFLLENANEAHDILISGEVKGKILLNCE